MRDVFSALLTRAEEARDKGEEEFRVTVRELAEASGVSVRAVFLALRRLAAMNLITFRTERGCGGGTYVRVNWHKIPAPPPPEDPVEWPTYPYATKWVVSCYKARRNVYPQTPSDKKERKEKSLTGAPATVVAVAPQALPLGSKGVFWACGRVRRRLVELGVDGGRRAEILAALGPALYRALRREDVVARGELTFVVNRVLDLLELEDRYRRLGWDAGKTRRWAEWAVREALKAARGLPYLREAREVAMRVRPWRLRKAEEQALGQTYWVRCPRCGQEFLPLARFRRRDGTEYWSTCYAVAYHREHRCPDCGHEFLPAAGKEVPDVREAVAEDLGAQGRVLPGGGGAGCGGEAAFQADKISIGAPDEAGVYNMAR